MKRLKELEEMIFGISTSYDIVDAPYPRDLLIAMELHDIATSLQKSLNCDCDVPEVTDVNDLQTYKAYWLVDKLWPLAEPTLERLKCSHGDSELKYFTANHIWAHVSNNQAFQRWRIFGPVPEFVPPPLPPTVDAAWKELTDKVNK